MYKSKLQELCQKKAWRLPEYNTTKKGQDHIPRFEATVIVNGTSFQSQNPARSSKEAQNDAARLAFLHFTSPPLPDSGSSNGRTLQPEREAVNRHSQVNESATICKDNEKVKDMQHLYKNLLQNFAQKRNLSRPLYSCEFEGPPHASRFRCKVTINEKTYESLEFFPTIKEAEHAAAKIALLCLSPNAIEKEDCSLCKNLLQELTQKEGCPLPVYTTTRSGETHASTFVSIVEVKEKVFKGQEAKTKKQAECLAAKVAFMNLKECNSNRGTMVITPTYQEREVHILSSSNLPLNVNADTQPNLGSKACTLLNPLSMVITPAHQEREVHILSSSNLLSNVNADTQPNLGSKACTLFNPISTSRKDQEEDGVNGPFGYHHLSDPFPQPEMTTDWQSNSSSDLYDHPQPEDDLSTSFLPSKHSAATISVEDSIKQPVEISNLCCNWVIVRPHVPKMKFPAGSTVLPMSDDRWVAIKLGSEPNQ